MSNQAKIIRAADQQDIWLLTDHMKPLLGGHDTNDELAITLTRLHPNAGPPPHLHTNEDEMFYVLEGEVTSSAATA